MEPEESFNLLSKIATDCAERRGATMRPLLLSRAFREGDRRVTAHVKKRIEESENAKEIETSLRSYVLTEREAASAPEDALEAMPDDAKAGFELLVSSEKLYRGRRSMFILGAMCGLLVAGQLTGEPFVKGFTVCMWALLATLYATVTVLQKSPAMTVCARLTKI